MGKQSDIRNEVVSRGISQALHFTQLRNLQTIVEHGLLPRDRLKVTDFTAYLSAEHRLDGADHAVSVSITAVDHWLFKGKRDKCAPVPWVVLVIDPRILWENDCLFHRCNAASNAEMNWRGYLGGPFGLQRMFWETDEKRRDTPALFKGQDYRGETCLPPYLPTLSEAEVQVLNPIPPGHIKAAWVENEYLVEQARAKLSRLPGPPRPVLSGPFAPVSNGYDTWLATPEA